VPLGRDSGVRLLGLVLGARETTMF
jgi:hypothetical protein